jgi:hypothetical protein
MHTGHRLFAPLAFLLLAGSLRGQDPSAEAKDREAYARHKETSRRLVEWMGSDLRKPEARPHDVAARAELLGRDPKKIREFVRKEIRFEPYPGLQRGAAGVLVSGAGNAPDKSLLLAELLRAAGLEARIVKGTLPRDKAEALVQAGVAAIKARPAHRFEGAFGEGTLQKERLQNLCKDAGIAPDEALRLVEGGVEERKTAWKDVLDLSAREDAFLRAQLEAAKIDAPEPTVREELVRSAQAHAWVQWKEKNAAAWTDADACIADLPEGAAPCASEGEIDPEKDADRFMVALTLQRKVGEKVEAVDVFRHEVPAPETLLRPMKLVIHPTVTKFPDPSEKITPAEFYARIAGHREFFAVLSLGEDELASMVFDYDGTVDKAQLTNGLIGRAMVKAVEGAAGAFGGPKPAAGPKGVLQSLWVDFRASRGGKALWSQRRILLEEGQQATWSPMLKWNLFLQSHEISRGFLRYVRIAQRLQNDGILQKYAEWAATRDFKHVAEMLQMKSGTYPLDLFEQCRARQAFVDQLRGGRAALHFPAPNLFVSGTRTRLHGETKKVCSCYSIDLVENGALVLDSGRPGLLDREATRALGAFDTVLEQVRLREANEGEAVEGTVNFFERARALGLPLRMIRAGEAKALAEAAMPASDVEWIRANADPDSYVIVAADAKAGHCGSAYAWWSVDPRTGRTVGRLTGGRGGAEVAVLRNAMVESAHKIANAACMAAGFALVFAGESGHAAGAFAICQFVGGVARGVALIPKVGIALARVIFIVDVVFSLGEGAQPYFGGHGGGGHE